MGGDDWKACINRKTGELVSFPGEGSLDYGDAAEFSEARARVLASADFVTLPDQFEIHEYDIMKRFCLSLDSERLRDRMLDAIAGRGAFRRFKDLARERGIEQDWYRFRDETLKRIAADFLETEGIPYVDDAR